MIRLTALYRNDPGAHFDFDYYVNNHLTLARRLLEEHGMQGYEVLRCTQKMDGSKPDYLCVSQVDFETLEGMRAGFATHKAALSADFAAYTNAVPEVHVCEIVAESRFDQ